MLDFANQLTDASEGAAANRLVGDQRKEALDEIEPGRVRGHEVHVPARPCGKPSLDSGMLVRAVVVQNQMHLQIAWHGLLDVTQEPEELLVTMARAPPALLRT